MFEDGANRYARRNERAGQRGPWRTFADRLPARMAWIVLFFAVAFVADQATGQRHSTILGSAAIAASLVTLWPWQRSVLLDAAGYGATWIVFALVRAAASETSLGMISPAAVGNFERFLFGGQAPSATLQDAIATSGAARALDLISIVIHVSFFVVPSLVAAVLLRMHRPGFVRYWTATGCMLLLATVGFVLAPTAPPWLTEADEVRRVIVERTGPGTTSVLAEPGTRELAFDPNSLAAMPSVHVAAAVLVGFACWRYGRPTRLLGLAYAVAMSVSVVSLGEHYVLDVLGGWLVAGAGWWVAGQLSATLLGGPGRWLTSWRSRSAEVLEQEG